jgi:5-methylcytosine-specific restriction protein A
MPIRPKRPCNFQSCNELVDFGYCELHKQKMAEIRRQEANEDILRPFYGCKRWRTTRQVILGRDPICTKCHKTASTVVHHVIDARIWIQQGNDFYHESNLVGICESCHNRISAKRQSVKYSEEFYL